MSGIGHNRGPSLEPGVRWRTHCWRTARAALLPKLPIEIVRLHVRRAAEIGLDYKTYAGVRATTGHDLVAFLFSTNALRLLRQSDRLAAGDAARLGALQRIGRVVAVQPPLDPPQLAAILTDAGVAPDAVGAAPTLADGWGETRARILTLVQAAAAPADRVLLIGDTALERDWVGAARLAGFLPADRYFQRPGAASGL